MASSSLHPKNPKNNSHKTAISNRMLPNRMSGHPIHNKPIRTTPMTRHSNLQTEN